MSIFDYISEHPWWFLCFLAMCLITLDNICAHMFRK